VEGKGTSNSTPSRKLRCSGSQKLAFGTNGDSLKNLGFEVENSKLGGLSSKSKNLEL
jgi:hypothetical protein